ETRLRVPVDAERLGRILPGRSIRSIGRRSKYLLVELGRDRRRARETQASIDVEEPVLLIHLGMSGRLILAPSGDSLLPHTHVRIALEGGEELRYRDPRRFGLIDLVDRAKLLDDERLRELGPEPLDDGFDGDTLARAARGRRQPVKSFIMGASTVVGVGNIYASESLYRASIHPLRPAGRIARERWQRLADSIREVLSEAIEKGGTTLRDWESARGEPGEFAAVLRVYGREGEPCLRCGKP